MSPITIVQRHANNAVRVLARGHENEKNPVDVIICWLVHYHLDAYFWILKENICR